MIDIEGHIKIVDFGFALKVGDNKPRSYEMCCSPEYIAPEMLI
jgi:protein kinase A